MKAGSSEWQRLITASKVAAILGVSPWASPYSTWWQMKNAAENEGPTEVQARGHYLEPAILAWWLGRHPEYLGVLDTQPTYMLGDWAAATPDARALSPEGLDVLVEAKSAAYDDDWGEPGTDVIPAYYLVQVQWQMHVSGIHRCYVPMIGPRLKFAEYVVDYDATTGPLLEKRMREFYDSLAADEPPALDASVATFDVIRKAHPAIDAKVAVELAPDVAAEFVNAIAAEKAAEDRARLARSTVLEQMGRANWADCNGTRIARRQSNGKGISFVPVAKTTDFINPEGDTAA